eukprot:snap_masked-scaffold_10-processed-gene-13.12-mRNA-1 protein AED:1.00 eAED:1.00 QI:0/0/0/0/1/1/3/0/220
MLINTIRTKQVDNLSLSYKRNTIGTFNPIGTVPLTESQELSVGSEKFSTLDEKNSLVVPNLSLEQKRLTGKIMASVSFSGMVLASFILSVTVLFAKFSNPEKEAEGNVVQNEQPKEGLLKGCAGSTAEVSRLQIALNINANQHSSDTFFLRDLDQSSFPVDHFRYTRTKIFNKFELNNCSIGIFEDGVFIDSGLEELILLRVCNSTVHFLEDQQGVNFHK